MAKRKNYKEKYQKDIIRLSLYFLALSIALIAGMFTVRQYDYVGQVLGSMTDAYLEKSCKEELRDCVGKRTIECVRLQTECGE